MHPNFVVENLSLLTALQAAGQVFDIPPLVYHAVPASALDAVRAEGLPRLTNGKRHFLSAHPFFLDAPVAGTAPSEDMFLLNVNTSYLREDLMAPAPDVLDQVLGGTSKLFQPDYAELFLDLKMPMARWFSEILRMADHDEARMLLQPLWRWSLCKNKGRHPKDLGATAAFVPPEAIVRAEPYVGLNDKVSF